MKVFLWIGCFAYLLIGSAHVVMGAVLEELLHYFNRSYSDGGQLIFAQFSGFLIGVLTAPWWSKRLGRRGLMILALGTLTAGETIYSFLPSWNLMIVAAPFAGFGFGIVEAAIGAIVLEFFRNYKAIAMSRLEVFFGIGACLMPTAGSLLIAAGNWSLVFPFLAVLSFAMLLLWSFTSFGSMESVLSKHKHIERKRVSASSNRRATLHGSAVLAFMIIFFVLYVGIEMSIVNFLPSVLIEHTGTSSALGSLSVTFFWIAMVIGRFFSGVLANKWGYGRYLLLNGFGALLLLTSLPIFGGIVSSYLAAFLLGLFMAGLFAIGLVFTTHQLPGSEERVTSLLIASGGLGGALLPLFTGWMMDAYPYSLAIGSLAILMAIMLIMLIIAIRYSRKLRPRELKIEPDSY